MKNTRHITKNDLIDNRLQMSNHQRTVPKLKLASGSVVGLFPVILDGGRTTIYISDVSKEAETRKKYELRKGN
jgi:hypothetical protein